MSFTSLHFNLTSTRGIFVMRNINKDLSWAVCVNMPVDVKLMLIHKLELIYPKALNTANKGLNNSFPACHFTYWF